MSPPIPPSPPPSSSMVPFTAPPSSHSPSPAPISTPPGSPTSSSSSSIQLSTKVVLIEKNTVKIGNKFYELSISRFDGTNWNELEVDDKNIDKWQQVLIDIQNIVPIMLKNQNIDENDIQKVELELEDKFDKTSSTNSKIKNLQTGNFSVLKKGDQQKHIYETIICNDTDTSAVKNLNLITAQKTLHDLGEFLKVAKPVTSSSARSSSSAAGSTQQTTSSTPFSISRPDKHTLTDTKRFEHLLQFCTFVQTSDSNTSSKLMREDEALVDQLAQMDITKIPQGGLLTKDLDLTAPNLRMAVAGYITTSKNKQAILTNNKQISEMHQLLEAFSRTAVYKTIFSESSKIKESELNSILSQTSATLSNSQKETLMKAYAHYLTASKDQPLGGSLFFELAIKCMNHSEWQIAIVENGDNNNYSTAYYNPGTGNTTITPKFCIALCQYKTSKQFYSFDRTELKDLSNTQPQTISSSQTFYTTIQNKKFYEVGGGGNCAAYALSQALFQQQKQYFSNNISWRAALENSQSDLRFAVTNYMFANAKKEFLDDDSQAAIVVALKETVKNDTAGLKTALQDDGFTALNSLLNKTQLRAVEKEQLVNLYATYIYKTGTYLDGPFWLAAAKHLKKQIVILGPGSSGSGNPQVKIFYEDGLKSKIVTDTALYVYYDETSQHYLGVNRSDASVNTTIEEYNKKEELVLGTFLKTLEAAKSTADNDNLKKLVKELEQYNKHAYLVLGRLIYDKYPTDTTRDSNPTFGHDKINANPLTELTKLHPHEILTKISQTEVDSTGKLKDKTSP